nr:NACHT domain-containing protein [Nocardia bovistercoris]
MDPDDKTVQSGVFTDILSLYSKIGSRRLVILGEPGSGKTTIVRDFAYTILGKYEGDTPATDPGTFEGRIPVIFNLSSWDSTNSKVLLDDWMADILVRDHPGLDPSEAKALIVDRRVLPIFEGLDEVDEPGEKADNSMRKLDLNQKVRRIAALTQLHGFGGPFILTCRTVEYRETARTARVLEKGFVIELEPLSVEDIESYLPRTANSPAAGRRWRSAIQSLKDDAQPSAATLLAVLENPLMVYLASRIFASGEGEGDPEAFVSMEYAKATDVERLLLGGYLDIAFPPPWIHPGSNSIKASDGNSKRRIPPYYPREKALVWLHHIAHNLDGGELKWWSIANKVHKPITALVFAIFSALVGTAAVAVSLDHKYLFLGPLVGALIGCFYGLVSAGRPPVGWSLFAPGSLHNFISEALKGPAHGITAALVGYPLVSYGGWLYLPIGGLAAGLTTYPLIKLMKQKHMNEWWPETLIASGSGFFTGVLMGIIAYLRDVPIGSIWAWLGIATLYGFFLTLAFGPRAHLQADTVATPSKMISTSRSQSLYYMTMNGLAHASVYYFMTNLLTSVVFGIAVGLYICITDSAWGRWVLITRGAVPISGRLPQNLVGFLEEAHHRGVLRQSGAVYLFRHKQLEKYVLEDLAG